MAFPRRSDEKKGNIIILLSARAGEEARVEGLQNGADDYPLEFEKERRKDNV